MPDRSGLRLATCRSPSPLSPNDPTALLYRMQRERREQAVAQRVVGAAGRRAVFGTLLEHAGPGAAHTRSGVVRAERVLERADHEHFDRVLAGAMPSVTSTSHGCETSRPQSLPFTDTLATLPYQPGTLTW